MPIFLIQSLTSLPYLLLLLPLLLIPHPKPHNWIEILSINIQPKQLLIRPDTLILLLNPQHRHQLLLLLPKLLHLISTVTPLLRIIRPDPPSSLPLMTLHNLQVLKGVFLIANLTVYGPLPLCACLTTLHLVPEVPTLLPGLCVACWFGI